MMRNIQNKVCFACVILFFLASMGYGQTPIPLHRGVNLFPCLYRARTSDGGNSYSLSNTFPYAGEYTADRLAKLRELGFDFVRIPVEPNALMSTLPAGREQIIAQIMDVYTRANQVGLAVIIDLHPKEAGPQWHAREILSSKKDWAIYRGVLVDLAQAIVKQNRGNVLLELMNEPPTGWSPEDAGLWKDTQIRYIEAVRHVAPSLPLVVTGDHGGGIEGLLLLDASRIDDPNIYYSFHYYDPMVVTHQGATWSNKEYRRFLSGIPYPPDKHSENATLQHVRDAIFQGATNTATAKQMWGEAEPQLRQYFEAWEQGENIATGFERIKLWARQYRIPPGRVLLGEFGVYRPGASVDTAARYLSDVRRTAEKDGFAWALFNYEPNETLPSFSMLQLPGAVPASFDSRILRALGLTRPN